MGTRSATHYGEEVAAELGRDLARAGVVVVSGLAVGIDGAAHCGALSAGVPRRLVWWPRGSTSSTPVVTPGCGSRWRRGATLLSQFPVGTQPVAWRFPVRNRIMAALAQVVVVVECHRRGGAMHTVEAAIERGTTVMAVPGSVRSPASVGTNALLYEGCQPVRDADDVLTALDLERTGRAAASSTPARTTLDAQAAAVLRAVDWQPTMTEEVLRRTRMRLEDVAVTLDRLEESELVRSCDGSWERTAGR